MDLIALSDALTIYLLAPDDAEPLLFAVHADDEADVQAAATAGATVMFTARAIIDSAAGPVLVAPRLQRSSAVIPPDTGFSNDPAPDEVLLPLPEDDVFAALSTLQPTETVES